MVNGFAQRKQYLDSIVHRDGKEVYLIIASDKQHRK